MSVEAAVGRSGVLTAMSGRGYLAPERYSFISVGNEDQGFLSARLATPTYSAGEDASDTRRDFHGSTLSGIAVFAEASDWSSSLIVRCSGVGAKTTSRWLDLGTHKLVRSSP